MFRRHLACGAAAGRVPHAVHALAAPQARPALLTGGQGRYFSIPNPFGKKKEPEAPAAAPEPTPEEALKAINAKEEEEILRYAEPEMTMFEWFDSMWDTVLTYISPFGWVKGGVYGLHNLGLEWWAAIMCMSLGVRLCFAPIQIMTTANQIRMAMANTDLQKIKTAERNALSAPSLTEKQKALIKNNYKAQEEALAKKHGYQSWKQFLGFAPMIPFGVVFYTIRSIVMEEESLATGGCLWFPDLTVADPTGLLPILAWVGISGTMEITQAQQIQTKNKWFPLIKWGQRAFTLGIMYAMSSNPAGIMVGFVISGFMGMAPALFLRSRAFRDYFKIPLIRAPPRSTLDVEPGGFKKIQLKLRRFLAGGAVDENNKALGGGAGKIAHSTAKLRNISEYKVAGAPKVAAKSA